MDLILLSGGHDSANLIRISNLDGRDCCALFVDYGQPAAARELVASVQITDHYNVRLIQRTMFTPASDGCEWLGRNMALIGLAMPVALEQGCKRILIGCTQEDHDRFPDCRPEFISMMDKAAQQGYGVEVVAPLTMRPSYIVEGTWSCYGAGPKPCGKCLSCQQG